MAALPGKSGGVDAYTPCRSALVGIRTQFMKRKRHVFSFIGHKQKYAPCPIGHRFAPAHTAFGDATGKKMALEGI